jgi:NADH:ubiquinone oxidoreductase subunit 3 (subunit A)
MGSQRSIVASLSDLVADAGAYAENNKTTVAIVGGVTVFAGLSLFMKRSSRNKPGTFDIGSGSVDRSMVESEVRVSAHYPTYWMMFFIFIDIYMLYICR